ncbi:MAG: TorF family putative porin [Methylophilaceae bacterium]|nr:MAG: TorF family putative porin [Methylophilaceae bacterium]
MRKSLLSLAILSTLSVSTLSFADEAPVVEAAPAAASAESDWAFSSNVAFTSDYYVRGISQNFHKPALQGGFDVAHSSGFSAGIWASNVSPNTFPDASLEIDYYAGYGGEIGKTGIGYSVGVIAYTYPGGSWGDCQFGGSPGCYKADGVTTASNDSWNTYEANFGLSYSYFSAQVSTTLGDYFGLDTDTGYDDDSRFTTYVELNAEYPFGNGWALIGHIGHLNVSTKIADTNAVYLAYNGEANPDYTDYKVAVSKSFSLAGSEGWAAELAYVGANDTGYWQADGWGGSSFNGRTETADLTDDRFTFTVSRAF